MADKYMEIRVKLPLINPDASIVGDNRQTYPSSQWESSSKSDFKLFFTPGPPAKFPEVAVMDRERKNNPHMMRIHREFDSDGNKWNAKSTIYGEDTGTESSGYRDAYTRKRVCKSARRSSWMTRQALPATSIVPGYDCSEAVNDRVLPVFPRDQSVTLTTKPFLQYTGKKKRISAPFHDGGVFYDTDPSSPRNAHVEKGFWKNVSSLGGKEFSRRKPVRGPEPCLSVESFDGGAQSEEGRRLGAGGVRTGYAMAHATMHRPE